MALFLVENLAASSLEVSFIAIANIQIGKGSEERWSLLTGGPISFRDVLRRMAKSPPTMSTKVIAL